MQTMTSETKTPKRSYTRKNAELIRDGNPIYVRFPPSIERELKLAAEEEGLLPPVWLRRIAVLELRRRRRGKTAEGA